MAIPSPLAVTPPSDCGARLPFQRPPSRIVASPGHPADHMHRAMSTTTTIFYQTGGNLPQNAPSYVERQADTDLYEGLSRGEFCYVLTSRQMGKSSLMVRTAARLREEGTAVAVLDLTAIGQNLTVEQWYDGLLVHLGRQLDLEDELEEYWLAHERWSPLQRWLG